VNDQHITVIATIVQDVLLLLSAGLIGWYLFETRRIRIATRDQVDRSQELVRAAAQQLETQIRPALVVYRDSYFVGLVNVGNGPALNLRTHEEGRDAAIKWSGNSTFSQKVEGRFVAVERSENNSSGVILEDRNHFAGENRKLLHVIYESLSGKSYGSVIEFDVQGSPLRTRFEEKPN
jgi:hypothetical protein